MPYDPFDPTRSGLGDDDYDRASRFDNEHQFDPELREGRCRGPGSHCLRSASR